MATLLNAAVAFHSGVPFSMVFEHRFGAPTFMRSAVEVKRPFLSGHGAMQNAKHRYADTQTQGEEVISAKRRCSTRRLQLRKADKETQPIEYDGDDDDGEDGENDGAMTRQ